jgi:hypothetical protein
VEYSAIGSFGQAFKSFSLSHQVVTLRRDYQFVDTAFEVQVFLQSQDGQIATGLGDLPVAVSLAYEAGADAPPQDMLALDSPPLVVNGRSALAVRLTDTSMNVGNRKVCLVVEATENGHSGGANGSGIAPSNVAAAKSAPIRVIRHKLELDIPANSWAGQWYKDEGGRDKAISLPVKLVDANGSLVIGREVPLTARLLYESGTVVPDQANVLKVHDSSSVGINQATGKGELKVRLEQVRRQGSTIASFINYQDTTYLLSSSIPHSFHPVLIPIERCAQVSRNHNHQDFQVELLPDTVASPLDLDVGTTTSNSVTVLSKRNRGTTAGAGSSSHASSSAPAGGGRRNQRTASHRPQQLSQGYATDPRTAAEAVAAAQAAVVEAVPLVELPHPQGGGGVYGSMENVLGWIQNALTVMETQGAVLQNALTVVEAAQAQHQALRSTLENAYTARIQEDLQLLVADFNSSSVSTDNGNSGPAEPSPPPPLALDLGSTPAPAPQPPSNDSASDNLLALARPSPMIRQTSSSYFSARGCVSADVEAALHSAPYAPMGTGGAGDSAAETSIAYIVAKVGGWSLKRKDKILSPADLVM